MVAIQTVSGRISRALDFLSKTDVWLALAHPFNWDVARLTGIAVEPFVVATGAAFRFEINGVAYAPVIPAATYATIGALVTLLQGLVPAISTAISGTTDKRLRITAPVPVSGPQYVSISAPTTVAEETLLDLLGFLEGEISTAAPAAIMDPIPPPNPTTRRLLEPFGLEKVNQVTKGIVVPNPATQATIIGTVRANTFDLSVPPNHLLAFYIDDDPTVISVTFPAGVAVTLSTAVTYINAAAILVSPDYGTVADIDGTTLPPALRLRSPTKGSTSKIDILTGNAAFGIPMSPYVVTGNAGGAIRFRNDQFDYLPPLADPYEYGSALVFISARFPYDQVPLNPYSQVGVLTGVVPKAGFLARTYLVFSETDDFGVLEFLDHRRLTPRALDQSETVSLVIEF